MPILSMPNAEEITIIAGLRSGGIERRRFENLLWKKFSGLINRGVIKYNLARDEVRHAYDDAICSVIINIVTGRYEEDANALLKTYAETIFHYKCIDRISKPYKNQSIHHIEKVNLKNPHPIKDSLSEMLPDEVKNAIEEIIEREDQMKMKLCLDKTGEVCKKILSLYASGYKDKEIAGIMKYSSPDVVKQTRYRCMEKLSENYSKMYRHE